MSEIKNRKPSPRQRKTAEIKLNNPDIEDTKLLALGGYSEGTQHTPGKVTESIGYKKALEELGLTQELITTALVSDIESKPKNRLGELRLGAEILKMNDSAPQGNKTLVILVSGETMQRYVPNAIPENSSTRPA